MSARVAKIQICSELLLAVVLGAVIASKSSWSDLDEVIAPYWHAVLFALGFLFALLGRSPAWAIGLATALVALLAAFIEFWAFGFELVMFGWMAGLVTLGAATGHWVARRWIRR